MSIPGDTVLIADLRNLGPVSRRLLGEIDVYTAGDIRKLGPALIYNILKGKGSNVSLNLVYAMEAAIRGIHWLELTPREKADIRSQCEYSLRD